MSENYTNHVISTKAELKTSGFGMRVRGGKNEMHNGVDLVDDRRTEKSQDVQILAFADGVVALAKTGSQSCGNYVDIAHDFGGKKFLTRYMHMKDGSIKFKSGQIVVKGDILGIMGTTGDSTGIHLHFQINENSTYQNNGTPVDPEPFLRGEKSFAAVQTAANPAKSAASPAVTQNAKFEVNERVKIKQSAKYYGGAATGTLIPSRVKDKVFAVLQVMSDGSQARLSEINSWVRVSDLERV